MKILGKEVKPGMKARTQCGTIGEVGYVEPGTFLHARIAWKNPMPFMDGGMGEYWQYSETGKMNGPVGADGDIVEWLEEDREKKTIECAGAATKHDGEKAEMWLLPGDALEDVANALTFGAGKYGAHNWEKGFAWSRLLSAALRHCFAIARGEWLDKESGLPHAAHACCCLLFLLAHKRRNLGKDDLSRGEGHDTTSAPT